MGNKGEGTAEGAEYTEGIGKESEGDAIKRGATLARQRGLVNPN
jgi:hypothetical protein